MAGILYVIGTPIGNLSDIAPRVAEALSECHFVLAEDTRVSIKILNRLALQKRLVSCHDFNEASRLGLVETANRENQTVALVSDAGTPLVSDPGYEIVQEAIRLGMKVIPIPGPSAFLLALVGSGLPADRFVFEGFLPDKPTAMRKQLEALRSETRTLIFYVSPHKLKKTLESMLSIFGDRRACLARELTKLHEEFIRASLTMVLETIAARSVLGECVLVVHGAAEGTSAQPTSTESELEEVVRVLLQEGLGVKEISHLVAQKFGEKRSKIYALAVRLKLDPNQKN